MSEKMQNEDKSDKGEGGVGFLRFSVTFFVIIVYIFLLLKTLIF